MIITTLEPVLPIKCAAMSSVSQGISGSHQLLDTPVTCVRVMYALGGFLVDMAFVMASSVLVCAVDPIGKTRFLGVSSYSASPFAVEC